MKTQSYVVEAWFMTNLLFDDLIEKGFKIIVPTNAPKKFHKLHTEKDFKLKGTNFSDDLKAIQKKYKNYKIFDLTCAEMHRYPDFRVEVTEFDLEKAGESHGYEFVAFVCVPKKEEDEYLKLKLEDYYNGVSNWQIVVIDDKKNDIIDEHTCFDGPDGFEFIPEDEKFFEKIKANYGVTQKQIHKIKRIIKSHKQSDEQNEYEI